jgi:hypothetical protein
VLFILWDASRKPLRHGNNPIYTKEANMNKNNYGMRILGGCLCAIILTACVAPTIHTMMTVQHVEITFDSAGCPTGVNPSTPVQLTKAHGDKIKWQALGNLSVNTYQIYLDPFVGKPLKSHPDGGV